MLEHSKERLAHMQKHLDALKTFYAVLTPEQQKIFDDSHQRMRHRMQRSMQHRMQERMQGGMHDHKEK
jgi:protein CpxP